MQLESTYTGPRGSKQFTTTIPAGGVLNTKSVAKSFYIVESDGVLTVTAEGRLPQDYPQKSGEVYEGELPENLQLNNNTGAPITFTIWFGFGRYIDGQADVLGSVEITNSVLPTGAATGAKQDAQTALLTTIEQNTDATETATEATAVSAASIDGKLPALSDGRVAVINNALGAQGNAWNAAAVLAAGVSASLDTKDRPNVSAFGVVDAATTITVQVSQDNATFYDTATNVVLAGAGDFHLSLNTGAKYARLKSSGAATITATIAAK